MSLKKGDKIGGYEITEVVGRGGMSTVYRAFQPTLQRHVAIKVLPEFLAEDRQFHQRFVREAATVAQLRHPNIVQVFDYGEEAGVPYIVMEFLPGDHLGHHLGQPLLVDETLKVLKPLADALDYAHTRGIVHRDVKPQNVMLALDGAPVLADFGLSQIRGSMPRLTRTGFTVGTAEYMAPEQANGDAAGPAVDRYAFAVVAYEMLVGRVPFTRKTELAVLLAHVNEEVPPPSKENPSLNPEVDRVFLKALAKKPEDRYPTAAAFVEALAVAAVPAPGKEKAGGVVGDQAATTGARAGAGKPAQPGSVPGWPWALPAPDLDSTEPNFAWTALAEAVQQPATAVPAFLSGLALIYLVVLSPHLGFALPAGVVAAVSAIAAAVTLFRSYPDAVARAEDRVNRQRRELDEQRSVDELARLKAGIREGLEGAHLPAGLTTLDQLTREFDLLQPSLTRREADPIAMTLLPNLANATYRLGLNLLADALGRANPSYTGDVERLRREIAEDERLLARQGTDASTSERSRLVRDFLESRKESLEMLEAEQLNVEKLCFQAQRCAVSLQRTRAELVVLRTGGTTATVDSLIYALQGTIDQAKDVQEEIRRLGYS